MEWDGTGLGEMRWEVMGWDGMRWDGMGRGMMELGVDGFGRDGTGQDWMELGGVGCEGIERLPVAAALRCAQPVPPPYRFCSAARS